MVRNFILLLFIGLVFAQDITIAVLDFEGKGVSQSETSTLTDRLRDELQKTGIYIVLERGKMDEVLKEQGFQQTGCITSECAVEVGRMLGVQQMVAGSIGKVGTVYTVSGRIFDVETGKILKSANYDHIGDIGQLLLKGMKAVVQQLITGKSSNNQVELSTPIGIGDTGNADERQEITERWPNGLKKTVIIYKGTGINETIEKLGFREDGQPDYKMNPATDWIYKYYYNESGKIRKEGASNGSVRDTMIQVGVWTWYYSNGLKEQLTSYSGTIEKPWKKDGLYNQWHENGKRKAELTFKDDEKDGIQTWWYENGEKKEESNWKDGKYDGLVTHFYENGEKKEESNCKDGNLDGLVTWWYENGQMKSELTFKDNEKDGIQTWWYENGQMKSEVTFKNDEKDGIQTWWYENGQKSSEGTYKNGKDEGKITHWYENGEKSSEGTYYRDGKFDGLATEWYENGQKSSEETYKDEKLNGLRTVWYENGQKYIETTYKDGEKDGLVTWWYESGQKKVEGTFKDGKQDGLWTWWYENGQKMGEGPFKNDKKDGLRTGWYENGQKKVENIYKDGKYDGRRTWWYENGQKKSEVTYEDDNQIEPRIDFDEHGEKRNGNWTLITDSSKIEGKSKKGKRHGEFKFYNEDGKIEGIKVYKKGFKHRDEKKISYDESGNATYMLTKLKKGKKGKTTGPFPFP